LSKTYISVSLRELVITRAKRQCEYCLIPDYLSFFPHEIDPIIAEKHGGKTEANNLAYSCWRCNRNKGTDLGSLDPQTGEFSFLYSPRMQKWSEHFSVQNFRIIGLTAEGRTTVFLLKLNTEERLTERKKIFP
jgi:hypothetical protein